tara:strand:+ start:749 stop:997 length:249 start_codon:yes stop_codon:yes gene_type:complete
MNPSLNSSDLQGLSDIWKNITNPTEDQPEATPPETPEASVDSGVEQPEVPEVEDNPIKDKLQSSGHFTDAELERIAQADKWK